MKNNNKLLAAAGLTALAASLGAGTAHAAGTVAGQTITNTVTVNFQVSGVTQTAQTGTNAITVDRRVVLTVTGAPATTSAAPGQIDAVTAFQVTNTSNDTLDLQLTAVNQAGGATVHGGTDVFDVTNFAYFLDSNTNGVYDAGVDAQITYLDEIAPDTTRTVFVHADIPGGATNAQASGITLTARAAAAGAAGTQGALLTATTTANTAGIDTVFADAAGATDAANDGAFSARGSYTVAGALLTVSKFSSIISDPVNGTTNPKAIPGAVVEYCLAVSNGAGAATATGLALSDPLPSTVTYNTAFGILVNATVSGSTCTGGTAGGTYSATPTPTVSGTLNNLAAGAAAALRFRVTIN
ncbi:hypothetical protein ACFOON_09945 [Novosphingobium piscinae]|uniref:DUF11 domain-containing protein n=1 Tax=Novosphingobium piscinae TaxID=1507448 RepID=A0A7X1G1E3_9SPHN|nr:hypothetical protein [Novosphingobium piscinae]MBC2670177.1 hypothetical protein [Novosphingobium piscinae]